MKKLIFITIVLLNLNTVINANEISGFANITDGDTVKILNNRIRLHGIDAPERNQMCKKKYTYNCGSVSTNALIEKINKNIIKCSVQKNKDRYNRYIGVCFLKEEDLNKWMVQNGYAVAYKRYSKDYVLDEEFAKKNKLN